jgi:hypothetical protein
VTAAEIRTTTRDLLAAWTEAPPEVQAAALRAAEQGARDALAGRGLYYSGPLASAYLAGAKIVALA